MIWLWTMCALSLALAAYNAVAAGAAWGETKAVGGYRRFLIWIVAAISAGGFTVGYGTAAAGLLHHFHHVADSQIDHLVSWWSWFIVPQVVAAVIMWMIRSWAVGFRQGGFIDYGDVYYNNWVPIHNTRVIVLPRSGGSTGGGTISGGSVGSLEKSDGNSGGLDLMGAGSAGGLDIGMPDIELPDDPKAAAGVLGFIAILVIATCAFALGCATTWLIIHHVSGNIKINEKLPKSYEQAKLKFGKKA